MSYEPHIPVDESKIVEPSKWGMRLCKILPHLWKFQVTRQEIIDQIDGKPIQKVCLTCRQMIIIHPEDDTISGQVPPHGLLSWELRLRDFLDAHFS